jgi:hypothetical protein
MRLFSDLEAWLSANLDSWEKFSRPNGDINYFSNMKARYARRALKVFERITDSYERLAEQREQLKRLYKSCQEDANIVSLLFYMCSKWNV